MHARMAGNIQAKTYALLYTVHRHHQLPNIHTKVDTATHNSEILTIQSLQSLVCYTEKATPARHHTE